MRKTAIALLALLLSAQTPQLSPAPGTQVHLVYRWGFNTEAEKPGPGTGTTTIDLLGPTPDGGVTVAATDWAWNTVRPRQTNVCILYANGRINCAQAPHALSAVQLTILPLLAKGVWANLHAGSASTWEQRYSVTAAVLPAATGQPFLSNPYTWDFVYTFKAQGAISGGGGAVLITSTGTFTQEGGYFRGSGQQKIAYDPAAGIPIAISDVRTHVPQRSVYSNDSVQAKLVSAGS
ncbi:MAG TPA: hypothetical protein VFN49_03010 [Candidatus Aquilonibacter sp.]|nr:hypothetical protein [Candidatus Aquilonibacter sp.]